MAALWIRSFRDYPGGPVVKNLPFNAEGGGSVPGQGAKITHTSWPKTQKVNNRSNIVTS